MSERKQFWLMMAGVVLFSVTVTGILGTIAGNSAENERSTGYYVITSQQGTYKAYDYNFFGEDSGLFGGGSKPHLHLDLCDGGGMTISNARATIKRIRGDCRTDGVGKWGS